MATPMLPARSYQPYFNSSSQDRPASFDTVIHFFALQTQWRQQPHHIWITRCAGDDALVQQSLMNWRCLIGKLESEQKAFAMDDFYFLDFSQTVAQVAFDSFDIC